MLRFSFLAISLLLLGCSSGYDPGPDKQGQGTLAGMLTGAGAGAVTGFQIGEGAALGPGAFIGAGFGAVAGGIKGVVQDNLEDDLYELQMQVSDEKDIAFAQQMLIEHYQRRIAIHPSRDIFPADWFFEGDGVTLKPCAEALVYEIARLNKRRFPYSRLVVASYVKTASEESEYAKHLAQNRSKEIGNYLVKYGIEPRRIETRGILTDAPVLIDPRDEPKRFAQAIEFIPVDR